MKKILVIDDSRSVRFKLNEVLSHAGYEVLEAGDGESGIKTYARSPVDLVITDIYMPDQDGLGVIMRLKEKNADVKIIAISGGFMEGGMRAEFDYLKSAIRLGAISTFTKPFEFEDLLKEVRRILQVA